MTNDRMRVLLVDDQPESIRALEDELNERGTFDFEIVSFEKTTESILRFRPGAVVLDLLLQGGEEVSVAGKDVFDHIWEKRFCPIVVYSAQPDALPEVQHPFVKKVQKGSKSEIEVANILQDYAPHVAALEDAALELDETLHQSLKEVAPRHFPETAELISATRRHVAARIDFGRLGEARLSAAEQYLVPPVHDDLTTGDILRLRSSAPDDPTAFRLVLTPSCDLVNTGGRSARAERVLVAKCRAVSKLAQALGINSFTNKTRKKVEACLNSGFVEGVLPLPRFLDEVPPTVADLRALDLIDFREIDLDDGDAPFVRIASIDSPFRELVTWAYLQIAGRPGLPDRDVQAWRAEIYEAGQEVEP